MGYNKVPARVEAKRMPGKQEGDLSRRDFLKAAGAAGAGSLLAATGKLSGQDKSEPEAPSKEPAVPTRVLGKTGARVTIICLGGEFDTSTNQLVLKQALKHGVTFWDTAPNYLNGQSQQGLGTFFEKNPDARKQIFLSCKAEQRDPQGMTLQLNDSLKTLRTDHIDLYMLHALDGPDELSDWRDGWKDWAEKAKKSGKIRFFGLSMHFNVEDSMLAAAKLGWVDAVMGMYNFRIMSSDKMKAAADACAKAKVGLIAIKSMAYRQTWQPTKAEWDLINGYKGKGYNSFQARLKLVWENQQIASVCVLMPNTTILTCNTAASMDKTKLTAGDRRLLEQYARETCSSYCAGCSRICSQAVGGKVPISDIMRYVMYYGAYGDRDRARRLFAGLPARQRWQLARVDYSAAEERCPRHMPIGRLMKEAQELLA